MAKAKTKAAVKRKPAKTQTRAVAARTAKAPKKAAAAKPAKASLAKPAKSGAAKVAATATAKASRTPPVAAAPRRTGPLTLPVAKPAVETAAPKPLPIARKAPDTGSARADLPPTEGFTLLVDGHFKNKFNDLKSAKTAASELKGRFPMLRVEIYDAAKKIRLPA